VILANTTSVTTKYASSTNVTPVVVLLELPGAVLMPWVDAVDAIAVMFLGGQETGNAWASVIFGDYAPTGHLPLSIPKTEADTIAPSSAGTIVFSEGMATGYRDSTKNYVFPFGHGLTYTSFSYGILTQHECGQAHCVSLCINNTGVVAAPAVPQLYVEFPADAQYTSPVLKGFEKTEMIQPGREVQVTFTLANSDISYWASGSWHLAKDFTVHVGASSTDIRQTVHARASFPTSTTSTLSPPAKLDLILV
jgi:beta-glucosidase